MQTAKPTPYARVSFTNGTRIFNVLGITEYQSISTFVEPAFAHQLEEWMSSHLRSCPKHRKPLPCAHCALAAKPVIVVMDPPKSAAAIRAAEWREQQKQ